MKAIVVGAGMGGLLGEIGKMFGSHDQGGGNLKDGLDTLVDRVRMDGEVVALDPAHPHAELNRANSLRDLRRFPQALDACELALQRQAGMTDAATLRYTLAATMCQWTQRDVLLADLIRCGYVRQTRDHGDYMLSTKLVSMGLSFLSNTGIVDIAQPLLDHLAQASGELVRLSVVDGEV